MLTLALCALVVFGRAINLYATSDIAKRLSIKPKAVSTVPLFTGNAISIGHLPVDKIKDVLSSWSGAGDGYEHFVGVARLCGGEYGYHLARLGEEEACFWGIACRVFGWRQKRMTRSCAELGRQSKTTDICGDRAVVDGKYSKSCDTFHLGFKSLFHLKENSCT